MATTSSRSRPADPRAAGGRADPKRSRRRIRWRRIPGRLILAVCFVVGVAALAVAVLPFSTTTADGLDLRCGPAVFEVLMPPDPAFDDIPENVDCLAPAKTRLIVAGATMAGVLLVAGITERRTRRGSVVRDTRWLAAPTRRRPLSSRLRRSRAATPSGRSGTAPAVGRGSGGSTAPSPR